MTEFKDNVLPATEYVVSMLSQSPKTEGGLTMQDQIKKKDEEIAKLKEVLAVALKEEERTLRCELHAKQLMEKEIAKLKEVARSDKINIEHLSKLYMQLVNKYKDEPKI